MANMTVQDGKYKLQIAAAGTKTLKTQDTYVDKDIDIVTPAGSVGLSGGAVSISSIGTTDTTFTQASSTGAAGSVVINVTADAAEVSASVTPGWVDSVSSMDADSASDSKTLYIKAGSQGTPSASVLTATAGFSASDYLTSTANSHAVVATAGATGTASSATDTTGWITGATKTSAVPTAKSDSKTMYIKEGALEVKTAGSVTASASGMNMGTAQTSKPSSGSYIEVKSTGSVGVKTAGWLDANTTPVDVAKTSYYPIAGATLANVPADDKTDASYTTVSSPVLTENGYLYINAGYTGDQKISLATLVPDNANITSTNANLVYNTVKAYDSDGKLIVGTMGNAALGVSAPATAAASLSAPAYQSSGTNAGKFVITASGSVTGTATASTTTTGLATAGTTSKTADITGSITGSTALNKVEVQASKGTDGAVKPVIADAGSTAAVGTLTTTKPSGAYVAVNTSAISASTTVTPSVKTAGYGDTTNFTSAGNVTVTRGASAADTAYIPLTAGSHDVAMGTATNAVVGASTTVKNKAGTAIATLSAAPSSGDYLVIGGSGSQTSAGSITATCTATEGYIASGTDTATGSVGVTINAADNKYIKIYGGEVV